LQETVNKLSHLVASSSNFKDDINILPPRVRACVRACVRVCLRVRMCVRACVWARVRVCVCARMCACARVCMEKEREREAYSNVFDDLIVWTVNSMDRSGLAVRR